MENVQVITQIGKGAFANVYLCKLSNGVTIESTSGTTPEYFIIKEVNINRLIQRYGGSKKSKQAQLYHKRVEEMIDSEVNVLNELDHENIVQFFGCSKTSSTYCISMEYCELGDLNKLLTNRITTRFKRNTFGGFDTPFVVNFIRQMYSAIAYLHTRGIIHKDIKLQNVLLQQSGGDVVFKLTDFGFACKNLSTIKPDDPEYNTISKNYFKVCGTPYYMAPEILINIKNLDEFSDFTDTSRTFYDNKIDLWSIGVCIYELLFNSLPVPDFACISELVSFYTNENAAQRYISSRLKMERGLATLLDRLLQVDPNKRATLEEFKQLVDNLEVTAVPRDADIKSVRSGLSGLSIDQRFLGWLKKKTRRFWKTNI